MLYLINSILVFQRGKFTVPYDSTRGTGPAFYWVSGGILLFIIGGVAKAFWDDKEWRGRFLNSPKSEGARDKKVKQSMRK